MPKVVIFWLLITSLYAQERIVTLSPAIAEIVSGIGAMEEIVAVSDYTLYPETLTHRPKVGGYMTLSLEKVLSHRPSLVIGLSYQAPFLAKLEAFGIPTLSVALESIDDIKTTISLLAKHLDHTEEGRGVLQEIDTALQEAPKVTGEHSALIVFASSSSFSSGVYVAGHDLFFEELLEACGATNAYSAEYSLQPVLNTEGIIATDPDSVLLLIGAKDETDPAEVKAQWEALPIKAAESHRIEVIKNDYVLIPSQRIAQSITTICEALQ